jgi:hypothetical protein
LAVFFHTWQETIAAVISELDELRGKFQHAAKELDRRVASEAALMARVADLGRQTEHLATEKTSLVTLLGSVETALEETEKKLAAAVKEKKRNAEERDEAVVQLRGARLQLADAEREAGNARAKEVWQSMESALHAKKPPAAGGNTISSTDNGADGGAMPAPPAAEGRAAAARVQELEAANDELYRENKLLQRERAVLKGKVLRPSPFLLSPPRTDLTHL